VLALLIVGCALFGLAIGSFLNVVIYRVPRHQSIVKPRSACTNCGVAILERDNIPLVSWLLLRGQCRNCKTPISRRYPLVELTCSALFAGAAARLGYNWDLPAMLVLMASLLALSCIDVELMLLPKLVVYPTLAALAALLLLDALITREWSHLFVAGVCAFGWFAAFFALNFANPRYLGFGDVRLAPVLGLGLGWLGWRYVVLGFFAANFIGAVIGIALLSTKRLSRDQPIPYGVFLALGAAFSLYAGPEILSPLQRFH
jgi:leader peptidase (prepilin peptidase) / N-methyltransferase